MLQQTRVNAVTDYYRKFLRHFPTVETLASAPESAVLAVWSGLGYYRRARMLHASAKKIVREYNAELPKTAEGLRALPGIGRYTAAAIASIAFNQPVALVDGNVERVLQRVHGRNLAGEDLWHAASELLAQRRPGDFNQAMMELGATICSAQRPAVSALSCIQAVRNPRKIACRREGNSSGKKRNPLCVCLSKRFDISSPALEKCKADAEYVGIPRNYQLQQHNFSMVHAAPFDHRHRLQSPRNARCSTCGREWKLGEEVAVGSPAIDGPGKKNPPCGQGHLISQR